MFSNRASHCRLEIRGAEGEGMKSSWMGTLKHHKRGRFESWQSGTQSSFLPLLRPQIPREVRTPNHREK
jgi:hypothetical protein